MDPSIFCELQQFISNINNKNKKNSNKDNIFKPTNLCQIPKDILFNCFQFLHIKDLFCLDKTCRYLYTISANPNLYFIYQ